MDHILSIVQFWISLDLAAPDKNCKVERFIPEWHGTTGHEPFTSELKLKTTHPLRETHTLSFQPDAAFVLERKDRSALFFLEVDRATETVRSTSYPDFTDKLLAYAGYRESGEYKNKFGDSHGFRVLTTTVSQARIQSYQDAAQRLNLNELFLFAPADQITPERILEPVWSQTDPDAEPIAFISSHAPAPTTV